MYRRHAIIDGNLEEAEKIKKQAAKKSAAKRMEKHRRNKGIVDHIEHTKDLAKARDNKIIQSID